MSLPKLPGYVFYDPRKTDYRKPQILQVTQGTMGTRPPRPEDLERSAVLTRSIDGANPPRMAPPREQVATFPDYVPAHVAYEHLVLRFFAYFRESVPESNDETFRIRYVKIMVYLEDDSIMIEENRVRNSGITQGVLLRRMRAVNPSAQPRGTLYVISDFNVGMNVEICGIVYRIYACDRFTEEYFASNGTPLGEFEEPPDDLYSVKRRLTERPIRVTYINTDKTNLRRFLDFDGKVLRFYSTWDDRKAVFGEKRRFILHFFLVDDTIEIRQILPVNSGRDPVSRLLMRTLLPKPGTNTHYTDADLFIGQTVDVFGRQFFLYDADQFTKDFLDAKFGKRDWTPIDVSEAAPFQKIQQPPPPYNGWGSEEDSLGYCYSLHPKPPRKDIVKFISKDGMLLRFGGKIKNPMPQDVNRKFVIVYYLADDTVGVFELPQRNSGFRSGKFIQRDRYKNVNNGNQYFTAQDFRIGEDITINGFTFSTYEADEYALSYMESQSDDFPQSDLFEIVRYLKRDTEAIEALRKQFESTDPELRGYITAAAAETALMNVCHVQRHEATTIIRRWMEKDGFDYFSFMSCLA